ncbi:hypothetical protein BY996DRAFT_4582035 [Phakopsora pachyrhizi]|uniref:NUC153 domain-containing protein n=1 Tax=Phakopsora pachyrhizi TaxID=170000 RepID=A0AAV0BP38_PHAPC|nr:hypothetical protein BY996DRAFT_4582035 [Phakopsora pachyrhizi]CAH7689073.1 hypothetical protein PPACK8108_LOCUS24137 [Phakopsora pachyrhizi]
MVSFTGLTSANHHSKVYTVNGGVAPGQNQPDWLGSTITRAHRERAKKRSKKKTLTPGNEGKSLIQDFDFPEASNKIKSTSDGKFLIATGTYKPRMKVFELNELAMKFDRVTDSENVDFCILSSDWTKTIHLQTDRTIDIHTQTASHCRIRIPRHGRALAYHFPSCDAICGGTGSEVWRLNLEEGRFLTPFQLMDEVTGVSAVDINPAHGLISLGTETETGQGTVEFWDHRARSRCGLLRLPYSNLLGLTSSISQDSGMGASTNPISVTALASKMDGLTIAAGTSTGHTLLYDLRTPTALTVKDQGYGLPIKKIEWPTSVSVTGFDQTGDLVATADSKVVKVWRSQTAENLISVNPVAEVNDMHVYPDSGLILLANEAGPMTGYFVPSLGPAPKWCRFLENMTEEMEDSAELAIYDDYKFVSDEELKSLNLNHLVGTPALRPYMHGYFVDLRLYAKAKAIANPFAYIEHREKLIKQQLEKEQESRIRTSKSKSKAAIKTDDLLKDVKINKELVQRILEEEEDSRDSKEVEGEKKSTKKKAKSKGSLPTRSVLEDKRFGELFTNEEFEIDEYSTEFAALNPSLAATRSKSVTNRMDSDLNDEGEEEKDNEEEVEEGSSETEDSSEDEVWKKSNKQRDRSSESRKNANPSRVRGMISAPQDQKQRKSRMFVIAEGESNDEYLKKNNYNQKKSFGRKLMEQRQSKGKSEKGDVKSNDGDGVESLRQLPGGGMEVTFVPSVSKRTDQKVINPKVKVTETFGIGLTKGPAGEESELRLEGESKDGRTKRRKIERSASKSKIRSF